MASPITEIQINGSVVDLSKIEYSISNNHGRSSVTDAPTASTCSMALIVRDEAMPTVSVGNNLTFSAHGIKRFTGRITDLDIVHSKAGYARFNIQAVGKVARLGTKILPTTSFVKEFAHSRALEILQLSGEDYRVEGGYDIELKARDSDNSSILEIFRSMSDDVGAAVVDTPDGKILVQFYDSRGANQYFEKWQDQGSAKWNQQTLRWIDKQEISPTAGIPLVLDANSVIYEPRWSAQSGNIINRVILGYDGGSYYTAEDTASQAIYGLRTLALDTEIHDVAGATIRTGQLLNRSSQPRFQLGNAEILMDRVTNATKRDAILNLTCGNRVQISNLPKPAPFTNWVAVVEGWSEQFTGMGRDKGTHRISLALSDPFSSYAGMTWNTLLLQQWNTINTSVIWANAITQQNLVP